MQSTHLVLGIGNDSKPVLEGLEQDFPAWQFAILDCWSQVQEIKVIDEQVLPDEDMTARFVTNLSYFTKPPKIALRFDNNKYDDAETQKIVRYPPHYLKLVKKEWRSGFSSISSSLERYTEILIVSPIGNAIARVSLLPLVNTFQNRGNARLFSWYPLMLEGQMRTEMAASLCEQLMDTQVTHYCFFQQEVIEHYKNETVTKVLTDLKNIQQQAVRSLMRDDSIGDCQCVYLL
jgi:hypothetical protein